MSTTASIAAKGCQNTGITEALAKILHDNLGKTITIVAEIRSESRGENLKGDETVKLAIQTLEVIPEDVGAAEHVREVAKTAHYNRKLAEDGPMLPTEGDGPEPKVSEVLAAGARHRPHPFLPDDAAKDTPLCDVCGLTDTAPIHSAQGTLPDPFAVPDDDADAPDPDDGEPADPDDPTYDTHDYIDDGNNTCIECEQDETAAVHTT